MVTYLVTIALIQVNSGLAIKCASDGLGETILRLGPSFKNEDVTIDDASEWM